MNERNVLAGITATLTIYPANMAGILAGFLSNIR